MFAGCSWRWKIVSATIDYWANTQWCRVLELDLFKELIIGVLYPLDDEGPKFSPPQCGPFGFNVEINGFPPAAFLRQLWHWLFQFFFTNFCQPLHVWASNDSVDDVLQYVREMVWCGCRSMTQKPAALDFRGSVLHGTIKEPTGATSSITSKISLTRRMLLQRNDQDPSLTHVYYSKEMIKIRPVKYFPMKKLGL